MKIIVDAMGGDYAPWVVIDGAVEAAREYDVGILLVGDEAKVSAFLKKTKYSGGNISIYPASDVRASYRIGASPAYKPLASSQEQYMGR